MTIASEHPAPRVLSAIMAEPWAILPGSLELILEIAARRGDPEALAVKRGTALEGSRTVEMRGNVAVIPVMGPIFPRASMFESISQAAVSVETLARDLQTALDDPSVASIVLNIDSPGGQVSGIHEFAAQVFAARGVKPIVAYIQGTGASAAYWIASATSRIFADAAAVVGSIGIVATLPKSDGKTLSIVSSRAPKKRIDPDTEDGRAEVVRTLDDLHAVFVGDVAAFRGVTAEHVEQNFGQGGVLVGARAVAAGLADALGSLEGVIAELSAPRPLAGNLNAEETIMPDANKPDAGGGPTAANQSPANPATNPTADDVLAMVTAMHGPEAAHAITAALADAAALNVEPKSYATLLAKFGAKQPEAKAPAKPEQPAVPTPLAVLQAALANPAAPGSVTPASEAADERIRNAGIAGANARSGYRAKGGK
ncbi:MAG: S49 family peptidase [Desulfovibrio sp.]